jgi:hypothetical protein
VICPVDRREFADCDNVPQLQGGHCSSRLDSPWRRESSERRFRDCDTNRGGFYIGLQLLKKPQPFAAPLIGVERHGSFIKTAPLQDVPEAERAFVQK